MRVVKATQAKSRLAELLRLAEQGETIAITRHNKIVAHLVPAQAQERADRRGTVEQVRALRSEWEELGVRMTKEEILAARHEGHRF